MWSRILNNVSKPLRISAINIPSVSDRWRNSKGIFINTTPWGKRQVFKHTRLCCSISVQLLFSANLFDMHLLDSPFIRRSSAMHIAITYHEHSYAHAWNRHIMAIMSPEFYISHWMVASLNRGFLSALEGRFTAPSLAQLEVKSEEGVVWLIKALTSIQNHFEMCGLSPPSQDLEITATWPVEGQRNFV